MLIFFCFSYIIKPRDENYATKHFASLYLFKTELSPIVIYYLSVKLKKRYPEGTTLHIIKPLYSLAEAENH